MSPPKLFISYSWSNPAHEHWVIQLATELRESGVDVILDKWELKVGNDAYVFMEQMVTNPSIEKVIMITDRIYAEKADGRSGGVGTETQIISREVYEKRQQDKFVAVVTEKNDDGMPYVPTYYKSKIHIDFSDPTKYGENFDQLLRWIYNKPLFIKPDIGKPPAFLEASPSIQLGTTPSHRRAIDAIRNNKTNASGSLNEYLTLFSENLERFRINHHDGEFDDAVMKNIEEFLPYRNEFIQIIFAISNYNGNEEYVAILHRFFERLIPYLSRPEHIYQWTEWNSDNFRFIAHELFLYTIAILIRYERFAYANHLMTQLYYVSGHSDYGKNGMVPFAIYNQFMRSLKHRDQRLNLNLLSLRTEIIKERVQSTGIDFQCLMQADFVLFMRSEIQSNNELPTWHPETLLYSERLSGPFEIFARAESKEYFDKIKILLGINSPRELQDLLESYRTNRRMLPKWGFNRVVPHVLLNYDRLSISP